MAQSSAKDEIYWKVLGAAMALDFKRGHQKWTIAELARVSGIKRPLIYYYFGKSRLDILLAAVRVIGEEFFGLSDRRLQMWKAQEIHQSIRQSRSFLHSHKDLIGFYFLHRARENPIGDAIRVLEKKHRDKIARFFPGLSKSQQEQIGAFFFGLVFVPSLSEEAIEDCFAALRLSKSGSPLTASL